MSTLDEKNEEGDRRGQGPPAAIRRGEGAAGARRAAFEVIPAIDLRAGRVVRLTHGRFDRETSYGSDPAATASSFVRAGARSIHVVDLDGALEGRPVQLAAVAAIVAAAGPDVGVELGGGLRSMDALESALATGVRRVVLGTRAIADPSFAGRAVERLGPDRVVAALDVRDGLAVGEGWRAGAAGAEPEVVLRALASVGVARFAVTAIHRDGTLEGPDLELLDRVVALGVGDVVASGGVASLEDLEAARTAGCVGGIVGRALYEGRVDLAEAIERFGGGQPGSG